MKLQVSRSQILSPREKEIIRLIVFEYSTKQIAAELCLGFETIRTYRSSIMKKLEVKNVAGIVRESLYQNLIQISPQLELSN